MFEIFLTGANKGHLDILDFLLKNKYVDVNSKEDGGWTSLHVAAFNGNLEMIKLLLQSGAQINSKDNDDWTPLHCSTCNWAF